jgi:hypothetical protein
MLEHHNHNHLLKAAMIGMASVHSRAISSFEHCENRPSPSAPDPLPKRPLSGPLVTLVVSPAYSTSFQHDSCAWSPHLELPCLTVTLSGTKKRTRCCSSSCAGAGELGIAWAVPKRKTTARAAASFILLSFSLRFFFLCLLWCHQDVDRGLKEMQRRI